MLKHVYLISICLCSFVWFSLQASAQVRSAVEIGGLGATQTQTPFWLRSNQYGTVPVQGSFGTLRFNASKEYHSATDSVARRKYRFDWGFGVQAVGNVGSTSFKSAALLPEAYVKIRFGKIELFGGNRREVVGLGDTALTSGFIAWSGNALPFPKIQLHTPDYVSLGFTKHLLAFRAGYAHGWFINTYIQNSYLHQKYLYFRLGKPNWKVRVHAGLNHQVQWGGSAAYLLGTNLAVNGKLPTSFRDYLAMVIAHYPDDLQNDQYTDFDGTNRFGNHIGSYDLAVEWKATTQNWMLYHQHIYEDASGLAFQNVPDGLTGIRFLNNRPVGSRFSVRRAVAEWLSTTDQSGPTFDQTARYQGADNYFNHSQYREGWSYKEQTLGTPFIMPYTTLAPAVRNLGGSYFPNNRIVAWYVGMEATVLKRTLLRTRLSYSRNFGAFSQPFPAVFHQFSALVSGQWALNRPTNLFLTTSLALDRGELLPDSFGSFISLRKNW